MRRIRRLLGGVIGDSGNATLLRDWLEGRIAIPSRTGERHRGKGLRAIHRAFAAGKLRNLIIMANDVFANIAEDRYETLTVPFHGTLIYWEIDE